jgi:AcrR family transcriptional regulator
MAHGFDAASMGEIAKAAGVSKGTLYVYFKDKDELFKAIVEKECVFQAEGIFEFDVADPDVEGTLTRVCTAFVQLLCAPNRQSPLRAVIAIADRMPNIGRMFYGTGPAVGIAKMRAYLEAQVAAGRVAIPDCEVAAAQLGVPGFHATLFRFPAAQLRAAAAGREPDEAGSKCSLLQGRKKRGTTRQAGQAPPVEACSGACRQ